MGKENKEGIGGTKILTCTCVCDYQDRKYGKGKRVFNCKSSKEARCTICLSTKAIAGRE